MKSTKVGEVLSDTFPVTTKRGAPVKGLLDKDFQKVLYGPDGAELSKQTPVTISELGNGMYRLNFRPDKIGHWAVTVSHPKHCHWGQSGTYQVEEAEAAVEETEESNPTPYVILRHWPDEPGPDLVEHWDSKLKNPQGTMYEWSSMDDPFETADGILGEVNGCCEGEKALELKGEIELAPGSPWNQTKVPAHLGLIQSGQVHFVTEEPGLVIAYLDQLPFRAVQEGNSDEWDITLGVWAAMSKERYITLIAMPVDEYDPKELPDSALDDDWRAVTSWLAAIRVGVEVDKTENEAQCYLNKIVQEIGNRGRASFNLSKMGKPARAMLADTLWDLYGTKGIYEPKLLAHMIADGTKTMKLEQKPWDLAGFYGLIDGENVIGMIRFEDREEITEEDFENSKAEHKLTKEEIHAWGWHWPVYGWKVREYVALSEPKAIDRAAEWARKGVGLTMEDPEIYAELRTLVEHTKDELERAGLFDEDSDYGGMLADSVMAIMKVFAKQGHSGFSAQMCRELFHRLSNFETLTPITSDPEEWHDISEIAGGEKGKMWQNTRNPAIFSEDGGKTWYNVETQSDDGFKTSTEHEHQHIWFHGRPRTSGTNGHDHAIDEEKDLALEANGHTHTLLKEPA